MENPTVGYRESN